MQYKTLGIIGGAGPMAGILVMRKIIETCQKKHGCFKDSDYPKIILLNIPFAEMLNPDSASQQEGKVSRQLREAIDFLRGSGAGAICIACNTLHGFLGDCPSLVNLVKETNAYIAEKPFNHVLTLCTKTSVRKNIYGCASKQYPDMKNQALVDQIIESVLRGKYSNTESLQLERVIISSLEKNPQIDAILLGCTELSVLHESFPIRLPGICLINPVEILLKKLILTGELQN